MTSGSSSSLVSVRMHAINAYISLLTAPWCGHCKSLAPEWANAAGQLKGTAKLGAVDATVHQQHASKYQIQGYPTILVCVSLVRHVTFNRRGFQVFSAGSRGQFTKYEGGRTASDIVAFAKEKATENKPPPEVVEITGQDQFTKDCSEAQV